MRYAGLHEDSTLGFEAMMPVEAFCTGLGIEKQSLFFTSMRNEAAQQP
jgi:hypothetical protein